MDITISPADAWDSYVGNQTPEEFWQISQQEGYTEYLTACEDYAAQLPEMMSNWDPREHPAVERIAAALAAYLETDLGTL